MGSMQQLQIFLNRHYRWIFPCLLVAIVAPVFTYIDLSAAQTFFEMGKVSGQDFYNNTFFNLLYRFGPWPALLLFFVATIAFVGSFFISYLKKYRRPALCLFLTMALGSGLIVHAVLKDHWGRPRPKQVIEFGGNQPFRPFYEPNLFDKTEPAKSFPCGHCSTGFYFFSLALILRRIGEYRLAKITFFTTLFWGGLIGLTRMVQGGHFFSDVVMAGLIMWLTALVCDWWVYSRRSST
jgi:lipid A 4'-phosphatase